MEESPSKKALKRPKDLHAAKSSTLAEYIDSLNSEIGQVLVEMRNRAICFLAKALKMDQDLIVKVIKGPFREEKREHVAFRLSPGFASAEAKLRAIPGIADVYSRNKSFFVVVDRAYLKPVPQRRRDTRRRVRITLGSVILAQPGKTGAATQ